MMFCGSVRRFFQDGPINMREPFYYKRPLPSSKDYSFGWKRAPGRKFLIAASIFVINPTLSVKCFVLKFMVDCRTSPS
jgi:hypothetical protein